MLRAYDVLYNTLENAGQAPRLNIIDNGESTDLTKLLQKIRTVVQLAPPYSHRRHSKEQAICTLKNQGEEALRESVFKVEEMQRMWR